MNNLPTLYSRTSTGAIQQWTIFVDGSKYYTESGQTDGQKTTSKPTVAVGKNIGKANETTPMEQAASEAEAKWQKQTETGYTENIDEVDTCMSYIKPMLAKELDDYINKLNFKAGVLVQNKYNGVRCVATLKNGKVVLKSRKGQVWLSVPHINKDLEPFFKHFPNAVLDGELFNNELRERLNELISLVRQTKDITEGELKKSEQMVQFYIYDIYNVGIITPDTPYKSRKAWLDEYLPKYTSYYRHVPTHLVYSMEEVENIYKGFLADKQEGAIIRIANSSYENKRSKYLLKYKPENDGDGVVLNIEDGDGNYAGRAKTSKILWQGKEFKATWMGDEKQGQEIFNNPKNYIGRTVTFQYTGITGKNGLPEYARINPASCFRAEQK